MEPTPLPTPSSRYVARSTEDLLAVAPVVLGFHPADSVVMLTFGLDRPFHARIDLPPLPIELAERREMLDELSASLLDPVRWHRPSAVVLLFYSADQRSTAAAWRRLRRACGDLGIRVAEAVRSDAGRYYPLLRGPRRLRDVGIPVDLDNHPFMAQAVVDGTVVHRSREEMAATVTPDPARQRRVDDVLARSLARRLNPESDRELRLLGRAVIDVVGAHVAARTVPDDVEAAWLLWAVGSVRARDAAWSLMTQHEAREHVSFWADVARRAPEPYAAPAVALLGWAAWLSGDGALAWAALDRCAEVEPGYSMADLLRQIVEQAIDPATLTCPIEWDAGLHDAG